MDVAVTDPGDLHGEEGRDGIDCFFGGRAYTRGDLEEDEKHGCVSSPQRRKRAFGHFFVPGATFIIEFDSAKKCLWVGI